MRTYCCADSSYDRCGTLPVGYHGALQVVEDDGALRVDEDTRCADCAVRDLDQPRVSGLRGLVTVAAVLRAVAGVAIRPWLDGCLLAAEDKGWMEV